MTPDFALPSDNDASLTLLSVKTDSFVAFVYFVSLHSIPIIAFSLFNYTKCLKNLMRKYNFFILQKISKNAHSPHLKPNHF
ncbi:hypothetical protein HDEF_0838 [Candidatus Hamiltonella defensa 5AT (Acyrthosiphon pisum)]|uniref:Uncharacterized protein n=1 Tax=Hamiltonella defensa subsp. Acyrthosiphon pisum (strain 5AT) TaxID=572265 RepID=C4K4R7_HAMD5|nr:hypothetical protein HDEF_0838 [Candidatus Hamiltonella defensa 5AT (Acyrthosiphon pisum)]